MAFLDNNGLQVLWGHIVNRLNLKADKVHTHEAEDLGDLSTLKDSMKRYGLLNPITVNSKHELVAGQRRLESAKELLSA